MTSNWGIIDKLLTVYLSEGMMIFTFILLIVSIFVFIKGKGHNGVRGISLIVGIYCILYLGAILTVSLMIGPPPEPAPPAYADAVEAEYVMR